MNHEAVYRTAPATPGLLKTQQGLFQNYFTRKSGYIETKVNSPLPITLAKNFTQALLACSYVFLSLEQYSTENQYSIKQLRVSKSGGCWELVFPAIFF